MLTSFYSQNIPTEAVDAPLKIMYSNIYKGNTNYQTILKQIQEEDPDLLLFVEFENHHKHFLKPEILKHYPYSINAADATSFIASKYPIKIQPTSVEHEKWKYYYFQLAKDDQDYFVYLVHTSSPTELRHFKNRNIQLQKISKDFLTLHSEQRDKNAKIIMLGDFNMSPWSFYYQQFAHTLEGKMNNITRTFPILFTWNLSKLLEISGTVSGLPPLLRSHIDQVFLSPQVTLGSIKPFQIFGSDHRGFLLSIK